MSNKAQLFESAAPADETQAEPQAAPKRKNVSMKVGKQEIDLTSLGVEFIKTPEQQAHAGVFALPPDFPHDKFVGEWVEESQVVYKQQRQAMPQVNCTVPGLTVWLGVNGKSKPTVRHVGGGRSFTLMVRPKLLQIAMNALYGNVSKKRYNAEIMGESLSTQDVPELGMSSLQDPGMVPVGRLAEVDPVAKADMEASLMALNRVPGADETAPESVTAVRT